MRIIKGPNPITCNNCGCQFEYSQEDIIDDCAMKEGAFLGILPLASRCNTIRCLICKHKIILEWK